MSNDGLLPAFQWNSRKFAHHGKQTFLYGFVSLFAGLVPVSDLGHGKYFIGFVLVCFWYIGRKKMPDAPRALRHLSSHMYQLQVF
jgi:APA family basic amino acid/polyamine antiporter